MKKFLLFFLSLLFLFISCNNSGRDSENSVQPPANGQIAGNMMVESGAQGTGLSESVNRAAVMVRGNNWVSGVPGPETNVFSALTGDYRLEGVVSGQNSAEEAFSVYVTGALLYYSDEWRSTTAGNIPLSERAGEDGLIVTGVLEDSSSTFWTVIFHFPRGLEGCGLDPGSFNQMFSAWTSRLLYYISQANTTGEISLPAVVEF